MHTDDVSRQCAINMRFYSTCTQQGAEMLVLQSAASIFSQGRIDRVLMEWEPTRFSQFNVTIGRAVEVVEHIFNNWKCRRLCEAKPVNWRYIHKQKGWSVKHTDVYCTRPGLQEAAGDAVAVKDACRQHKSPQHVETAPADDWSHPLAVLQAQRLQQRILSLKRQRTDFRRQQQDLALLQRHLITGEARLSSMMIMMMMMIMVMMMMVLVIIVIIITVTTTTTTTTTIIIIIVVVVVIIIVVIIVIIVIM